MLNHFVVSTDDQEIAEEATRCGASPPFLRPKDLASDRAPTWPALVHAMDWFERDIGGKVAAVVTLQPTTPLRTSADVDSAVRIFLDHQPAADSLIAVCRAQARHPLTLYTKDSESSAFLNHMVLGQNPNTRRQDFPPVYWRNGAIYITRRDLLAGKNQVVSEKPLMFEMPEERSVNIDSWIDLAFADFWLASERQRTGQ